MEREYQTINFKQTNQLVCHNIVSWNGLPYTIYDVDYNDGIIYLKHPDNKNVGIPETELKPILLTDETMKLCGFDIEIPMIQKFEDDKCKIKTVYRLYRPNEGIDMTVSIIISVDLNKQDTFIIPTINQLDPNTKIVSYLHQLQNLFWANYGRQLIEIS